MSAVTETTIARWITQLDGSGKTIAGASDLDASRLIMVRRQNQAELLALA